MLLYNKPNKIEMISHLLDAWETRLNKNLKNITFDEAKKMAEEEDIETDVASIIVSAHQSEMYILKDEFKQNIKRILKEAIAQDMAKKT